MSYLGEGRSPAEPHFLELAKRVDISPQRARDVIDQVRSGTADLKRASKEMGAKSLLEKLRN
jgi:hypothetical protein